MQKQYAVSDSLLDVRQLSTASTESKSACAWRARLCNSLCALCLFLCDHRFRGLTDHACCSQDGAIANQTARSMRAAFAPKTAAAARLLEAAAAAPLHGVAFFSSVAGQLGSAGQANYGAANAALDAAAERLQTQVSPKSCNETFKHHCQRAVRNHQQLAMCHWCLLVALLLGAWGSMCA